MLSRATTAAGPTRQSVLARSLTILVGARTRPWAREPDSIRRLALAMYISVLARRVLLARAIAATSQVFLTKRLPAEFRFSLTQTISSARVLPQSGSRKTSSQWIKQAKDCFRSNQSCFVTNRKLIRTAEDSLGWSLRMWKRSILTW